MVGGVFRSPEKEVVKLCEQGNMPWLTIEHGRVTDESKKAADATFLMLGGRVLFLHVEPMKSRSKSQRRGWGELASELVSFAKRARALAAVWLGENAVVNLANEIRKISGFGGKRGSLWRRCCSTW